MSVGVSVVIVSKNEEQKIAKCLKALGGFDDVWVVDSNSTDRTCEIAREHGAHVVSFEWDGRYPKKRQWCLDTLDLKYDRVFFVDADEIVTPELVREIGALDMFCAGCFIKGRYVVDGQVLKHGLCNNKLALIDRRYIEFPVIDDLDIEGMGEIEGHYQPVLKAGCESMKIGQIDAALLHYAHEDEAAWEARHLRYAQWEAGMNARNAWPQDPVALREFMKRVFRKMPMRGAVAFLQSYIFKAGFLNGRAGFDFARSRMRYYRMISRM